ncbi:MAG TPA: sigma-54 dependent transcriptional regulator [Bryobacteraceae bacterium]|nr:sigma-54 dependent transcriptional regulator [Bryobacteraceae bacterium]
MAIDMIVVVERAPTVSRAIQQALWRDGYSVASVGNGQEAARTLAELNGRTVLLVVDLEAVPDGAGTLRQVSRLRSGLRILATSTSPTPAQVVEAIRNGATDYSERPPSREVLVELVRSDPVQGRVAAGRSAGLGEEFLFTDPSFGAIRTMFPQMAASDAPVLLRGESGVGKEVLARAIHARSARADRPFVKLNCAAFPSELLESEFFGYERGAFTGAVKSTPGKLEVAEGGVVLLDEIGDMDVRLQAKLLHVLQDGDFQRLGGSERIRLDVRFMAATHCDLEAAIAQGRFREDLYYRLNVIAIRVPPLRERKSGLPMLARHLLEKHSGPNATPPPITPALEAALLEHSWPGNVRELENVMRRLLVFRDPDALVAEIASEATVSAAREGPNVATLGQECLSLSYLRSCQDAQEREAILHVLEYTYWNRRRAAQMLSVNYKQLLYRMRQLGLGTGGHQDASRNFPAATEQACPGVLSITVQSLSKRSKRSEKVLAS